MSVVTLLVCSECLRPFQNYMGPNMAAVLCRPCAEVYASHARAMVARADKEVP